MGKTSHGDLNTLYKGRVKRDFLLNHDFLAVHDV